MNAASLVFGGLLVLAMPGSSHASTYDDPAAALTRDVESIASAGVPGPLAVFGERAWVIVAGNDDQGHQLPVVAAAEWGKGRVVAVGHGGMISGSAVKSRGTAVFLANATRWLLHDRHEARIGVVRNLTLAEALNEMGIGSQGLNEGWHESLSDLDVLIVDAHSIGDAERSRVREFILKGGGLLTAGLGWGWLQLNPGKTMHEHPGNLLLAEAGVAWCDGYVSVTTKEQSGFAVQELHTSVHAARAIEQLEHAAAGTSAMDAQAQATLTSALRVIPKQHAVFNRARSLLATRVDALHCSDGRPLRSGQAVERVLMSLTVEVERQTPANEVNAHPSAAAFPGEVPRDAPRIERSITIDRSIPGWHSTGLYAAAGDVLEVEATAEGVGCMVQVGCHADQLWHHAEWKRVPDIVRRWPLGEGATQVASAFGGLVYIDVSQPREGSATFVIRGAVEAPRFVLGVTTDEQWRASRLAPAPWGELESRKVIVSVPSSALRTLADPQALMRFWDQISDAHATLATIPLVPKRPHRFVPDVQISAGYMHSGYPIMTHLDAVDHMTVLETLREGSWGLLHELGHNHQESDWTFDGTGEVTCNLFALHAIDTICAPKPGERGHPAVDTPPSLLKHVETGARFDAWKRDPFLALHMYVQLQREFEWETFKRVFAEYRALPVHERPRSDEEKRDQWMVRFSRACGHNLGPFFQAWGVPTSEPARASIAHLPAWMPGDWPRPDRPRH